MLERIGDKWSILVLMLLDEESVLRFYEIQKYIDTISQKMLSVMLKSLEADGLVLRKIYPHIPPKVEYSLTELGKSLMPHFMSLTDWANSNFALIMASRDRVDQRGN